MASIWNSFSFSRKYARATTYNYTMYAVCALLVDIFIGITLILAYDFREEVAQRMVIDRVERHVKKKKLVKDISYYHIHFSK